jgi:hypothetical protein
VISARLKMKKKKNARENKEGKNHSNSKILQSTLQLICIDELTSLINESFVEA